jgi:hypothetical protein
MEHAARLRREGATRIGEEAAALKTQASIETFHKNRRKSGYKGFSMKEIPPDLMEEIQALL